MQKINFQNLPSTSTPVNATNLNAVQTNVEDVFNGTVPTGNMVVDSIKSKNVFNLNNLTLEDTHGTSSIDYDNGTINMTDLAHTSQQTLKELCPTMKVGETYTLSFTKEPDMANNYIYLDSSAVTWNNGTSRTIIQTDLDGIVYFYGGAYQTTTDYTMSQIQIEKGTNATSYVPYQNFDIPTNSLFANLKLAKNVDDLNSALVIGQYAYNPNTLHSPYQQIGTTDQYGLVFVLSNGANVYLPRWVFQIALTTWGNIFIRTNINNGGWSSWLKVHYQ